jgi:hypothetical protein
MSRRPMIAPSKRLKIEPDLALLARLTSLVTESPDPPPVPQKTPCWVWKTKRYTDPKGYCQIRVKGVLYWAHRVYWSVFKRRPIPEGWEADHRCKNTSCLNPDHIKARPMPANRADIRRGEDIPI